MTERPILFSAPMVRAILEGRKTQTRRAVKLPRGMSGGRLDHAWPDLLFGVTPGLHVPMADGSAQRLRNPWQWPEPSQLWVRETFAIESNRGIESESIYKPPFADGRPIRRVDTPDEAYWQQCHYRATDQAPELYYEDTTEDEPECKWKPPIHMPRWASRILLEIVSVRVERLQDISVSDAIAEGYDRSNQSTVDPSIKWYSELWETINGPGSWHANPWVWVIEFKAVAA